MTGPWTIWLASYPKSGNTWVRAMLASLTSEDEDVELDLDELGGGPIASARGHIERRLGFASSDLTQDEIELLRPLCDAALDLELEEVRFRKIHDALWSRAGAPIVPPDRSRAAIYVVRDPRDVAVSYAHHAGASHEWAVAALSDPTTAMIAGDRLANQVRQHLGTWGEHVSGWLDHDLFPVLVVRYEDIAADPISELRRLARFAGLDPPAQRLRQAVRSASFDVLRAREERFGFHERPRPDLPFFRSGRAGGWRDELLPELAAQVERDHGEVMRRLRYEPALARPG